MGLAAGAGKSPLEAVPHVSLVPAHMDSAAPHMDFVKAVDHMDSVQECLGVVGYIVDRLIGREMTPVAAGCIVGQTAG